MQNSRGFGDKPAYKKNYDSNERSGAAGTRRPARSNDSRVGSSRTEGAGRLGGGKLFPAKSYSRTDEKFKSSGVRRGRPGITHVRKVEKSAPPVKITSDLQITDGKLRGILLQNTLSPRVRLTSRLTREELFKIIFRKIRGARLLDLCAGSGMVGVEAISRGACLATFVESSAKMCAFIKKNLEICGIKIGHGEIVQIEAAPFLKRMEKRRRVWDVVYFDPPYDADYNEVLDYFARGVALRSKGLLIIEHHADMFFPEQLGKLKRSRVMNLENTAVSLYERE